MLWIKLIILNLILVSSTIIGITFSKKYTYRVKELQEMKNALNIFMTKIKFTYEPIPSTFLYISEKVEGNVSKIFKNATEEMENKPAGEAWDKSLDAINYAVCSGVKGIFTAHGSNMEDIIKNPILNKLYNANTFELILFLDKNREIVVGCDRRNLGGKASNNA